MLFFWYNKVIFNLFCYNIFSYLIFWLGLLHLRRCFLLFWAHLSQQTFIFILNLIQLYSLLCVRRPAFLCLFLNPAYLSDCSLGRRPNTAHLLLNPFLPRLLVPLRILKTLALYVLHVSLEVYLDFLLRTSHDLALKHGALDEDTVVLTAQDHFDWVLTWC